MYKQKYGLIILLSIVICFQPMESFGQGGFYTTMGGGAAIIILNNNNYSSQPNYLLEENHYYIEFWNIVGGSSAREVQAKHNEVVDIVKKYSDVMVSGDTQISKSCKENDLFTFCLNELDKGGYVSISKIQAAAYDINKIGEIESELQIAVNLKFIDRGIPPNHIYHDDVEIIEPTYHDVEHVYHNSHVQIFKAYKLWMTYIQEEII